VFVGVFVAFPALMYLGHGSRHWDWAARAGDAILGVIWVIFVWALLGNVLRLALVMVGVADPVRSRIVAAAIAAVSLLLVGGGTPRRCACPVSSGWTSPLPGWVQAWTASGSSC
jgi:hypothetical protein